MQARADFESPAINAQTDPEILLLVAAARRESSHQARWWLAESLGISSSREATQAPVYRLMRAVVESKDDLTLDQLRALTRLLPTWNGQIVSLVPLVASYVLSEEPW